MDQNIDNFHIILPSNASMKYFPKNTPDQYRTKLIHPVTLNGDWECSLVEATIPGTFFTIQENYNDDYVIEKRAWIEKISDRPEYQIPLKNNKHQDFVDGLNENITKVLPNRPIRFSFNAEKNMIQISLDYSWDLHISRKNGLQMLYALFHSLKQDAILKGKSNGRHVIDMPYRNPIGNLENQFFSAIRKIPIVKHYYVMNLKKLALNEQNIFEQINTYIELMIGKNVAKFKLERGRVSILLMSNVDIIFDVKNSPKLMNALNINQTFLAIRGNSGTSETSFEFRDITNDFEGETFEININELFTSTQLEQKTYNLKIPSGMYHDSKTFFSEFKEIKLEKLANNKVKMNVPKDIKIKLGEKLKDILGFTKTSFEEGEYISPYQLELSAGITEIYLYSNIVMPSIIGDTLAPILKVIPIANEHGAQIVKHFAVPLYFKVKNQHFDTIQIEMRTSNGSPIKFISGKTTLVLSFRKKSI